MNLPNESGLWLAVACGDANRDLGCQPFVVDVTNGKVLVRLANAIHGWPLWFEPDPEKWQSWAQRWREDYPASNRKSPMQMRLKARLDKASRRHSDIEGFLKRFDEVQKRTAKSKLQLP